MHPIQRKKGKKKNKNILPPREIDYEFVEGGPRTVIEEAIFGKKKEFSLKWKKEEWIFETKSEEETKAWVNALLGK